jgi:gp45 sliding clamp, C terminal
MITKTKMKLSRNTLNILKNMSAINSNLLIKQGNVLKTVSPSKCVFVEAKVDEDFPVEVAIWDLGQFLGVVSLFNEPEFEFDENYVNIQSNNSSVKYYYSVASLLTVPTKNLTMPPVKYEFELTQDTFQEISKAAAVLQVSDLDIKGENGVITLTVSKKTDPTSNSYSVEVGETDGDFSYSLDMANLRLLPGDYMVSLTDTVVSRFAHNSMSLNYYIAVEKN